jgi:large subunit ribosomal protein L23
MRSHYEVIKRPLITEKNTIRATTDNEFGFEVAIDANRTEIKQAVEKLFGVKVVRVNTMVARRSPRRALGRFSSGSRVLWKKALVKLKEGDKFDFVAN